MIGFRFIFLVTVAIVACSVHPPEPEPAVLPEITMEGLNTFGCTVDGIIYEARGGWRPPVEALIGSNSLLIQTWDRTTDERITVEIEFNGSPFSIIPKKYFEYERVVGMYPNDVVLNNPSISIQGRVALNDSSFIEFLKVDEASRIISGTFQFDAETVDGDTIQIRKGRFDVTAG